MVYPSTIFSLKSYIPDLPFNVEKTETNLNISFILSDYNLSDLLINYEYNILTIKTNDTFIAKKPQDPKYTRRYPQNQPFYFKFSVKNLEAINATYNGTVLLLEGKLGVTKNIGIIPLLNESDINDIIDGLENGPEDYIVEGYEEHPIEKHEDDVDNVTEDYINNGYSEEPSNNTEETHTVETHTEETHSEENHTEETHTVETHSEDTHNTEPKNSEDTHTSVEPEHSEGNHTVESEHTNEETIVQPLPSIEAPANHSEDRASVIDLEGERAAIPSSTGE